MRSFLRQRHLFERAKSGEILHVLVRKVRNIEVQSLILGYGGYPLRKWLVKPFSSTTSLSKENRELMEYFFPLESPLKELSDC